MGASLSPESLEAKLERFWSDLHAGKVSNIRAHLLHSGFTDIDDLLQALSHGLRICCDDLRTDLEIETATPLVRLAQYLNEAAR